jgi:peptidoglycan hydrolase-like protein with peptidoglycan-binding domain
MRVARLRQLQLCDDLRRVTHSILRAILLICRGFWFTRAVSDMMRIVLALLAAVWFGATGAMAQSDDDVVWIQIEAQPSLASATDRARAYTTLLQDVNGFALGGGWYGIAVGPYTRRDAELVLRSYRRDGLVPRDSFIQFSAALRQQFWPVGANLLNRGVLDAPTGVTVPDVTETPLAPATQAPADTATPDAPIAELPAIPDAADETVAEARLGERLLDAEERKALQVALQWAGFYDSSIDGAFGSGTRASMAEWQEVNGFERTGVLTTLQRAALLKQYNAVLDDLGLELVRDAATGIEMLIPTGVVEFREHEPPFAQYNATSDLDARVLLISQEGDQDTLFGLYDIMQTLEIVPPTGPRERKSDRFELIGENSRIVSQTQVGLSDGQIKGFTLIWPAGDEERRTRLVAEMSKSFTRIPGVLDAAAGSGEAQAIDLVSGLQIRQPKLARSGFFIDGRGTVATTSEAVQSCRRLTLDEDTEADVIIDDAASGVALLKPRAALAPQAVAQFSGGIPRLQSEISVGGFPYEGVLGAASVTFGKLSDVRGLGGEENLTRLALATRPGDAGGPVFDGSGHVIGMLMPRQTGAQQLPDDVNFALDRKAIAEVARKAGIAVEIDAIGSSLPPRDLRLQAQDMTVLVSCWE